MIAPHEADGVQEILRLLVARGFIYDIVKEVAHGQLQALLPNCFGRQWIVHIAQEELPTIHHRSSQDLCDREILILMHHDHEDSIFFGPAGRST